MIPTTAGAKSNPRMPWGRRVTRPQGVIFFLTAVSILSVEDFHYGVGMVADDSFEKALSTLLESTDVAT